MLEILNKKDISIDTVKKFELNENELAVYLNDSVEYTNYDEIDPSSGCMMCKDYAAELADISIGCIDKDKRITSIVVRTEKGDHIKNYLDVEEGINVEQFNHLIEKNRNVLKMK